ncbi:MAG TPA: hypothetical protein VLT83_01425, partial [Opitutaceae bacterium]|nr:hypothetical protein [Opitutaceae bacterium]
MGAHRIGFCVFALSASLLVPALLPAQAAASGGTTAAISSPVAGATLSGASVTFAWNAGSGASGYWLDVGTTQGARDISGQNAGLATSQMVSGIPTSGRTIYVRLWTQQGAPPTATWQYNDYTYTAAGAAGTGSLGSLVTMTSPAAGSKLPGSAVTFTWTGASNVTAYSLSVGSAQYQSDLYSNKSLGTATSVQVTGLPTDARTLYVGLYAQVNGAWGDKYYTYTAAGDGGTGSLGSLVMMNSPAAGSKLPGSAVTFTWTGAANITAYSLSIGSAQYQSDLYSNKTLGLATSQQVTGLPTDGRTLYVGLYAQVNGAWGDKYYTYAAAGDANALVNNTSLPQRTVTPNPLASAAGTGTPSAPVPPAVASTAAAQPAGPPGAGNPPSSAALAPGAGNQPLSPSPLRPASLAAAPSATAPTPPPTIAQSVSATAEQTPALLANFPILSGATRTWFSSSRAKSTWQERATYTAAVAPDSALASYAPQLAAAGWDETGRSETGDAAAGTHQFTLDYRNGQTSAHVILAQNTKQGTNLSVQLTSLFPGSSAPALSTGSTAAPATGAAASASDRGARDPAEFSRLPGSIRTSFTSTSQKTSSQEIAIYTAKCSPAAADAFYTQSLPDAGWDELTRDETLTDASKSDQISAKWQNASRIAVLALSGS